MAEVGRERQYYSRKLQQGILQQVARISSSTADLRGILDDITKVLAVSLKKDSCSICLTRPENKMICIESSASSVGDTVNAFCVKDCDGIVAGMFHDDTPLIIEDLSGYPFIKSLVKPGTEDFRSLIAVPIPGENTISGILMLQDREAYFYSEEDLNMLALVANNISTAIRNADVYANVKKQLDELRVVHEIGKAITSILNIDDLLPHICSEVSKLFNVSGCILRLMEGTSLHVRAYYGAGDEIKKERPLAIGEGIAGLVAQSGKPVRMARGSSDNEQAMIPGISASSVICAPLTIAGRVTGTISLFDKNDEWGITDFTEEDLTSIVTFASVSSIAIENARLYRAEIDREYEILQTKDYLKSLIDDSADAIITSDTSGNVTSWNKGAENIYGFSEDEVIGRFLPMVPQFLREEENNFIRKIQGGDTLRNLETIRQTRSGRLIEVSLTLSPILDTLGNVNGISGISRDISEKKLVEKELIRKNQELSRLFFINSVVRSTLELDKLLKMVLTVVTMGDGLGFNRAILFLLDESGMELKGTMAVGPASPEEAKDIWLSMEGKSLGAIIEEIEKGPLDLDSHLDRLSQGLSVDMSTDCILCRCISEKRPLNVQSARKEPLVSPGLIKILGADSFGVVPLVARDRVIGLIWVDNLFTGRPIKDVDLQFLMGFSSHIASAIENARLFENVNIAQAELKHIFESISDMVYYTDNDMTIRKVNQAVVKRIGKPEGEIIGKKCFEIFHGKNEPWELCPHFKSSETKQPFVGEIEDPYLGGTFVVSNSPIFDSSDKISGTVHISRDITELRNLRERVAHAERMAALGELAARVAHEIRNPLISIGGFARRLEKKLGDDTREYASIIVNEVTRLETILKEILGFVRSSRVNKSSVDMNELINEIIDFVRPEVDAAHNTVIRELYDGDVLTFIDPDRIREAILNIISNAAQATEHGTITVRTGLEGNEAVLELSDTGCGINDEDLKSIFNPFFTTKAEGTGLGLAVTHKIIQEHNGKIRVRSVPGGGTVFKIFLPVAND